MRSADLLESLDVPALKPVITELRAGPPPAALRRAVHALMYWPPELRDDLIAAVGRSGGRHVHVGHTDVLPINGERNVGDGIRIGHVVVGDAAGLDIGGRVRRGLAGGAALGQEGSGE